PEQSPVVFASGAAGSPEMGEMDFPAVLLPLGSKWAIGQIKHGDETDITLYATPHETLGSADVKWTKVCDRTDLVTSFAVHGDDIYLLTARDAPRFRVIRTSLGKPNVQAAQVIVPASSHVVQ